MSLNQERAAEMRAYEKLRLESRMIALGERALMMFRTQGSIVSLRAALVEAHGRFLDASCEGMFDSWLEEIGISVESAHFFLGKKGEDGRFPARGHIEEMLERKARSKQP